VLSAAQNDRVAQYMTKFARSAAQNPYTLMTPGTELADLERFLEDHHFALGPCPTASELGGWLTLDSDGRGAQVRARSGDKGGSEGGRACSSDRSSG
jgi:FAD/FMN-containing dehydrogenase